MRDLQTLLKKLQGRLKGDFVESEHPRADDGKFGEGSGGAASSKRPQATSQSGQSFVSRLLSLFGLGKGSPVKAPRKAVALSQHNVSSEVASAVSTFFGKPASAEQLALLTGAPKGSSLHVDASDPTVLTLVVENQDYKAYRNVYRSGDELVIENSEFNVSKEKQGRGLGASIFAQQVADAAAAGISRIVTRAAGEPGKEMNGYYTWPRLGYDGPLQKEHLAKLPSEFAGAKTVQQLIRQPGGLEWWKKNGSGINLTFDLKEGSESRAILDAYLTAKSKSPSKALPQPSERPSEADDLSPEDEAALDHIWHIIATELSKATLPVLLKALRSRLKGDFVESEHPRADDGKFGEGGGSAKPSAAQKPASSQFKPSKAAVAVLDGTAADVDRISKELLGEHAEHIASLVGAPDDAKVYLSPSAKGDGLNIKIKGDGYSAERFLRVDKDGKKYIKNYIFEVDEDRQGSGIGSDVFSRQVAAASAMGISYLVCDPAGRPGDKMNGYYTWPRMGYDVPIGSLDNAVKVKKQFPEAKTLLDVMASKEGREWWKANGLDIENARFDLTSDSRSMNIHAAYMAERAGRK